MSDETTSKTPFIYLVTDGGVFGSTEALLSRLQTALSAHHSLIAAVHFREYRLSEPQSDLSSLVAVGKELVSLCHAHAVPVVTHGPLHLANQIGADGVQLSADRLSNEHVAELDATGLYFAASTHTLEELIRAERFGARYAFYSPVFSSISKEHDRRRPLGVRRLQEASEEVDIPIIALGGITSSTVAACKMAGASGVAGIAFWCQDDRAVDTLTQMSRAWS